MFLAVTLDSCIKARFAVRIHDTERCNVTVWVFNWYFAFDQALLGFVSVCHGIALRL